MKAPDEMTDAELMEAGKKTVTIPPPKYGATAQGIEGISVVYTSDDAILICAHDLFKRPSRADAVWEIWTATTPVERGLTWAQARRRVEEIIASAGRGPVIAADDDASEPD